VRKPAQTSASSDVVELSSGDPVTVPSSPSPVDLAAEMVTIIEARIGVDANLKVITTQKQLDRNTLDLFG
jgi:flagellar basal body rod protein FlgG